MLGAEIAGKSALTIPDAIAVMQKPLYDTENAGFDQTVKVRKALAATSAASRADYWFYLAAAYGQMHALTPGSDSAARGQSENEALHAAERAVAIDKAYVERLRGLTDAAAYDNDLASLADHPRFKALLT